MDRSQPSPSDFKPPMQYQSGADTVFDSAQHSATKQSGNETRADMYILLVIGRSRHSSSSQVPVLL